MQTREIFIAGVLMFFMFGIGIYPAPLVALSNQAVVELVQTIQSLPNVVMVATGH
jgi:NADH:ubiquinone oxidoreductase subunit 4 (subunit M)